MMNTAMLKRPATTNSLGPKIPPAKLKECMERAEVMLIDVREPMEFARERIEGAKLVPLSRLSADEFREMQGQCVVIHCNSGSRSEQAAKRLASEFGLQVTELEGGIEAWKQAGLPTIYNPKAPIPIMRQVQITAGSLVLIGTLLGAFVSPWFLILSGFVGAGLMFAGASGWCGMAKLLGKLPWNRVNAT